MWPAVRTVVISTRETLDKNDEGTGLKFAELAMALFRVNEMFLFIELSDLILPLAF